MGDGCEAHGRARCADPVCMAREGKDVGPSDPVDTEAEALVLQEVTDHVTEILFDALNSVDPDCVLCKQGVTLGVWARFGYPDPFAEDDGGSGE